MTAPNPPGALLIIDQQQGIRRLVRPRNNPDAETHIAALLAHWRPGLDRGAAGERTDVLTADVYSCS
ncbi:hypothetical protein D9M71_790270 [compost metagenome]